MRKVVSIFAVATLYLVVGGTAFAQWTQAGLDARAWAFFHMNGKHYAATTDGVYISTDAGINWALSNEGLPAEQHDVRAITGDGTDLFIGLYSGGAWRSTDAGATWFNINTGLPLQYQNVRELVHTGSSLYRATSGGLLRGSSVGAGWTAMNEGLESSSQQDIRCLLVLGTQGGFFAGTADGVYRKTSTSSAALWMKKNEGLPTVPQEAVNDLETYGPYIFATSVEKGVFRSEDLGETWIEINNGIDVAANGRMWAFAKDRHYLFVSGFPGKVFRSGDQGMNWEDISEGLPESGQAYGIYSDGSTLFVGTQDDGVWSRPMNQVTSVENSAGIADVMVLEQNYPNPFNPSTTIRFTLAASANVTLYVTDALGREVRRLIDGEPRHAGEHSRVMDASGLTTGVYFYHLVADGRIRTRQMQLLK